eukprot:jgi/Mesen1/6403/ME000329S05565
MAALASLQSLVLVRIPTFAAPQQRVSSVSSNVSTLKIEAAHHVNKKATGKHVACRPKKRSLWDKKRGGTKDYGTLPPAPPIWGLDLEESEKESAAPATPASS